jgi:hypothetical protein
MFRELRNLLHKWEGFGKQFYGLDLERLVKRNAKETAEIRIQNELIRQANNACTIVTEFNYPPLKERLIENLKKPGHVWVSMNLRDFRVVNENLLGGPTELIEGQRAAWGPKTAMKSHSERLFAWTYGIYKPSREGTASYKYAKWFEDLPSYEEVIRRRLDYWGEQAPYWYLIEEGNMGQGAYPTFQGYPFVENTRAQAPGIIADSLQDATQQMRSDLQYAFDQQQRKDRVVKVGVGRTAIGTSGGKQYAVQRHEQAGTVWYQLVIDGRFGPKVGVGERLPTGDIFGGM